MISRKKGVPEHLYMPRRQGSYAKKDGSGSECPAGGPIVTFAAILLSLGQSPALISNAQRKAGLLDLAI